MTTILIRDHHSSRSGRFERGSRTPTSNDNKDKMVNSASSDRGSGIKKYQIKCWNCKKTAHQAKDCRLPKGESTGQARSGPGANMIQSDKRDDPLKYVSIV